MTKSAAAPIIRMLSGAHLAPAALVGRYKMQPVMEICAVAVNVSQKLRRRSQNLSEKGVCMKKAVLMLLCLALLLCGCGKKAATATGFALDTVIEITDYSGDKALAEAAVDLCAQYDHKFSNTIAGSDISKLNAANGAPVAVSKETIGLLRTAVYYSKLSGGKFDVTISPASSLWDFESGKAVLPDAKKLAQAVTRVDYRNIVISGTTVALKNGAQIDLGAIAKGYISAKIRDYLIKAGSAGGIVNLGGNVVVYGDKPDKSDFSVAIKKPFSHNGAYAGIVMLSDGAVVTSGTYERCFTLNGKLYHHILDPATGMPAETGLSSVTIISKDPTAADALSTTCFLLGEKEGKKLIESMDDTEAVFIREDGTVVLTSGIGSKTDTNCFCRFKPE